MADRFHFKTLARALLAAGALGLLAPAHGAQPAPSAAQKRGQAAPAGGVSESVLFQIVMAEIALQRGQLGPAWSTYMSLARETRDPRLVRRAVEIAYADRALDRAIDSARLWNQIEPQSREVENTLVSLLVEGGRLAEAEPKIAARIAAADDKALAIDDAQRLLVRAPDRSAAFAMLDRLALAHQNHPAVRLALARGAALAGNDERALAEAREALALAPQSEIIALTTAQLLARRSPAEATGLLADFVARNPKSVAVRLALGRSLAAQGRLDEARGTLQQVIDIAPDNLDARLALGLVSAQAGDYGRAKTELEAYVARATQGEEEQEQGEDARDLVTAYFALAEIAEEQKRYDEANGWLDKIEPGPQYLTAQTRIARNLARVGRVDEARTLLQAIPPRDAGEQQQLVSAEAQVLREARQYQAAFDVLGTGLKTWPDSPELLYDYALAAEKVDRPDLMETTLRRVMELRPEDAHAYNALGYWLADRTDRLDEAETLIGKALALAPDDAYIIDSMGWLQYRRGRNERAIELLERAYGLKADPEIAAHLGEVYWVAGKREQAEAIWRRARERDPNNETLAETLARHPVKF